MKIEADEAKQQRIQDSNYTCDVCNKRFGSSQLQLAHIIPKHKNYIKRFGLEVIHHPDNLVLTCDKCNSSVMLNPDTIPGQEHINNILRKIYENRLE